MPVVSGANRGGDPSLLHTVKRKVLKGKKKKKEKKRNKIMFRLSHEI
jgi:hypothetical protein